MKYIWWRFYTPVNMLLCVKIKLRSVWNMRVNEKKIYKLWFVESQRMDSLMRWKKPKEISTFCERNWLGWQVRSDQLGGPPLGMGDSCVLVTSVGASVSIPVFTFMHWRRKWQPTPVFLPGESQGLGSLVGCRLWGRTESDTIEAT